MNKVIDLQKIRTTTENYYRNGDFYCSEAIVKTIKDEFGLSISDDIVAMASGFPVGIGGSGCTCGAVSGGIMALGSPKHMEQCISFTGEVAEETAKIIIRELNLEAK